MFPIESGFPFQGRQSVGDVQNSEELFVHLMDVPLNLTCYFVCCALASHQHGPGCVSCGLNLLLVVTLPQMFFL